MAKTNFEKTCREILEPAGITINGNNPWDIKVNDSRFYARVLSHGSLGLGESYMDGWWDCQKLDEFFCKLLSSGIQDKVKSKVGVINYLKARLVNRQKGDKAFKVGERHYDLGNKLFQNMLDSQMNYSCGYWLNAKNLDDAQKAKLDLSCRKLELKPGETVFDIGCGWGNFALYAAKKFGVKVKGVTISKEQAELARKRCQGFPADIEFKDYKEVQEKFDKTVSIGMFEHVGRKNYKEYMKKVHDSLKSGGLFLLHTIAKNTSTKIGTDPWLDKYIFPNGELPTLAQISRASEGLFSIEDVHNFGPDYDKTLMAWHANFTKNWDKIKATGKYDNRFKRMWDYYLLSCAGTFRSRTIQLYQVVLSKGRINQRYNSVR